MLLMKCWPSGQLRELKNKGKSPLVIHKSGRGRLPGTGRLLEWTQGEV